MDLDEGKGLSPTDSHSFDPELSGVKPMRKSLRKWTLLGKNQLQAEIVTVESPEIGLVNNVNGTVQHAETHEKRDQLYGFTRGSVATTSENATTTPNSGQRNVYIQNANRGRKPTGTSA
jgi:hypothetical protein